MMRDIKKSIRCEDFVRVIVVVDGVLEIYVTAIQDIYKIRRKARLDWGKMRKS